jgi:predicted nucleic acid-binding protein
LTRRFWSITSGVSRRRRPSWNSDRSLLLSTVVVAELYAGVRDAEREQLATALSAFQVCPVTEEIARRGGLLPIRE